MCASFSSVACFTPCLWDLFIWFVCFHCCVAGFLKGVQAGPRRPSEGVCGVRTFVVKCRAVSCLLTHSLELCCGLNVSQFRFHHGKFTGVTRVHGSCSSFSVVFENVQGSRDRSLMNRHVRPSLRVAPCQLPCASTVGGQRRRLAPAGDAGSMPGPRWPRLRASVGAALGLPPRS